MITYSSIIQITVALESLVCPLFSPLLIHCCYIFFDLFKIVIVCSPWRKFQCFNQENSSYAYLIYMFVWCSFLVRISIWNCSIHPCYIHLILRWFELSKFSLVFRLSLLGNCLFWNFLETKLCSMLFLELLISVQNLSTTKVPKYFVYPSRFPCLTNYIL